MHWLWLPMGLLGIIRRQTGLRLISFRPDVKIREKKEDLSPGMGTPLQFTLTLTRTTRVI